MKKIKGFLNKILQHQLFWHYIVIITVFLLGIMVVELYFLLQADEPATIQILGAMPAEDYLYYDGLGVEIGQVAGIEMVNNVKNSSAELSEVNQAKNIVASKSGKRYYYLNCSGVSRIKEENKVYFASEQEAEAAGLTLAANCKK